MRVNAAVAVAPSSLQRSYVEALNAYLSGADEDALGRAYEIGRVALSAGVDLLEVSNMHHAGIARLFGQDSGPLIESKLKAAEIFFAEFLSPYHMAQLGFQDAIKALHEINEKLEMEVRRIAHTLHDEAGQLLVVAHLKLADMAIGATPENRTRIREIADYLTEVETGLRRISHELRPTILDDLGLVPAIESLTKGFSKRTGIATTVEGTIEKRLPTAVETALYRALQEALTNAAKHSRAKQVQISIRQENRALRCSVKDDGVGFDARLTLSDRSAGSLGLLGIRERIALIGGQIDIESVHNGGTELRISVPLDA